MGALAHGAVYPSKPVHASGAPIIPLLLLPALTWPCAGERAQANLDDNATDILSTASIGGPVPVRGLMGMAKKRHLGRFARHRAEAQEFVGVHDQDQSRDTAMCYAVVWVNSLEAVNHMMCPEHCGYVAEESPEIQPKGCYFRCVRALDCGQGTSDPKASIPDPAMHYCRRCNLPGCTKCALGSFDMCLPNKCALGYYYDGSTCVSRGASTLLLVEQVLQGFFFLLAVWYADLRLWRPTAGHDHVRQGLALRERTKLLAPRASCDGGRSHCPLLTNFQLTRTANVAGPGTVLHFNFQMAIVVWASLVAAWWFVLVSVTEEELFILGTRPASTPIQFCGVLHRGYHYHVNNMWVKVLFLGVTYVFSIVGSIVYAAVQLKRFHMMDDCTTMKDFVAVVKGLPRRLGNATAEEDTKVFLQKNTGEELVGVSICWNIWNRVDEVNKALEADMHGTDDTDGRSESAQGDGTVNDTGELPQELQASCIRRLMMRVDGILFRICGGAEPDVNKLDEDGHKSLREMLLGLETTGWAFAIFKTERSRDKAVATCRAARGFQIQGMNERVTLQQMDIEPETIDFSNFGRPHSQFLWNLINGLVAIIFAQTLWALLFYLPYAYYMAAFTYAHGDTPDSYATTIFTLLVVVGNQLMYQVCGYVSDSAGFMFRDNREAFYTVLYSFTCFLNIVVDIYITGLLAYRQMVGLGVHTRDGTPLADLESPHDILEAFSMQKTLGNQIWSYNFPSTFLIPFIVEPVIAIGLFRHLMILIVGSRPDLSCRQAEKALQIFVPMDMSRYADILLNVLCCVLCFFCASGYYLRTTVALALSHLWILMYDHYRVLRCVPGFCYSSDKIDRISQAVLAVPWGLLLVALIFKSNCMSGLKEATGPMCVRDAALAGRMLLGFTCHMVVFLAVQIFILPRVLSRYEHVEAEEDYFSLARRLDCTWFSCNPVHCLRSKLIHNHSPHCFFWIRGREHPTNRSPSE